MKGIQIDTDVLEYMRDTMERMISGLEESLAVLKQMLVQMSQEEGAILAYPEWTTALDLLDQTSDQLFRTLERFETMYRILRTLPEEYREREQRMRLQLERCQMRMATLEPQLRGVMSDAYPAELYVLEKNSLASRLTVSMEGAQEESQMANLTGLCENLRELYGYHEIQVDENLEKRNEDA